MAMAEDTLAPLGPWIRSTQYGKRKMENKDRKYYSNPSQSPNFGHYSPLVPASLLAQLAAMKLQTQDPMTNNNGNQQQSNREGHREDQATTDQTQTTGRTIPQLGNGIECMQLEGTTKHKEVESNRNVWVSSKSE
ncbi:hypothetical protein TSUD_137560 [Trifolium subterraneum]|uniref:Uncharacterized protein n=1 Tax=Trifolium subterraneum TaxID=3900 RepID=A0A2Z6NWC8_TRISU|nr:hypothetical protein TSUD_137560 [Trifolium subterraneum]